LREKDYTSTSICHENCHEYGIKSCIIGSPFLQLPLLQYGYIIMIFINRFTFQLTSFLFLATFVSLFTQTEMLCDFFCTRAQNHPIKNMFIQKIHDIQYILYFHDVLLKVFSEMNLHLHS